MLGNVDRVSVSDLIRTFGFRLVLIFLVLVPNTYVLCLLYSAISSCPAECVSCVVLGEWLRFLMLCLSSVNHLCYWRQWFTLSFVHPFLCLYLNSSACTHISSLIALSYHHSKSYSCNCNPLALSSNTTPASCAPCCYIHNVSEDLMLAICVRFCSCLCKENG